jgi:Domain of unknown function (DUF4328)
VPDLGQQHCSGLAKSRAGALAVVLAFVPERMEAATGALRPIAYRSPRGRAAWALVAVACATAIAIVNGAAVAVALLDRSALAEVALVAAVLILLAPLLEMTLVPAAVAAWTVRCRRNLGVLPEHRPRWSPAWAAGGWFIPVANLFVPLLCLRETWSASAGRRPPLLLLPWWLLWLTRPLPATVLVLIGATAGHWSTTLGLALAALSVAAPVLSGVGAMVVVLRLTLLQQRRLRPLQEGPAPAPTWLRPPRPARAMATVAIAAIVLATLGGAVMLAANTISLALGSAGLATGPLELRVAWVIGLGICVLFGPGIGTIATALWARRAYRNLPALGAPSLGWSPGWAAASWFIPTANLALPYLVVRDAWPGRGRALLRWWWATLLTTLLLGVVSTVLHVTGTDLTQLAGDVTGLAGDLVLLQAGALAVVVILTITRHQVRMVAP